MKNEKAKTKAMAVAICVVILVAMSGVVSAADIRTGTTITNDSIGVTPLEEAIILGATTIDFDDLDGTTQDQILTHYPGVTFSPGYKAWDSDGSSTWPPHSPPNVAYTHEITNYITFDNPVSSVSGYFTIAIDSITITVYDENDQYIEAVTIHDIKNQFVEFDYPSIKKIVVTGTGSWTIHWTLDDLSYGAEEPTVSIYTDASAYDMGDVMHLGLDVTNPGDAQDARFAIWLESDGAVIYVHTYTATAVTLPSGLDYSNQNFMVVTLPGITEGHYEWNAAIIEPTGPIEFIDHDTAPWTFGAVGAEKWAVIVGNVYAGTPNELSYTDDDAYDMYDTLISGGWQVDHVQRIIDADRATIESAIGWLASNAGPDDTALFFFSGHGTYVTDVDGDEGPGDYYDEAICPTDFNNIIDDELDAMLDAIDSDAMAVIIDSCFSGGMGKAAEDLKLKTLPKPKVNIGGGFGKDIGEPGRVVLMACDEDESSWETSALQNGVFAYYVVEGLLGAADANSNGEVSAEETFNYADPLIVAYPTPDQHPQIYDGYPGELGITTPFKLIFSSSPLEFE